MRVPVVVSNPYFTLSHDDARGIWRLTRSSVPLALADVEAAFSPVVRAVERVERTRAGLLIDIRDAPFRNDPPLEVELDRQMRRVIAGFLRFAVLVKTSTGALQVSRVSRQQHQDEPFVFRDEMDAVAFLLS